MANDFLKAINGVQDFINQNNPLTQQQSVSLKNNGFAIPATYQADGNGLPYNKVPSDRDSKTIRNIVTWFIPQFGIVRMYVNPSSISYSDKKLISKERTKGGYTLQYWGEELTTINISGTTGSAGIEGINVLHEIYRAEQYSFDSTGLTLAANNFNNDVSHNLINGASSLFSSDPLTQQGISGVLGGIVGVDSPNNTLSAKNIPSLAQLAFTVEMYYNGWVFRGYFDSMTLTERADNFSLEYQIVFVATQRRGYRSNYFPWSRSAKDGPSEFTTPSSFSGSVKTGK